MRRGSKVLIWSGSLALLRTLPVQWAFPRLTPSREACHLLRVLSVLVSSLSISIAPKPVVMVVQVALDLTVSSHAAADLSKSFCVTQNAHFIPLTLQPSLCLSTSISSSILPMQSTSNLLFPGTADLLLTLSERSLVNIFLPTISPVPSRSPFISMMNKRTWILWSRWPGFVVIWVNSEIPKTCSAMPPKLIRRISPQM